MSRPAAERERSRRRPPPGGRHTPTQDARGRAIDALIAIDGGARSQSALSAALDAEPALSALDRGLLTELVYGSLRRVRLLDAWAASASDKGLVDLDAATLAALRVGLHQLSGLDRVPAFAAIDGTVEAAKGRLPQGRVGYLHAVLRRLAREAPWSAARPADAALVPWQATMIRQWAAACGVDGDELARAMAEAAPSHVHVIASARDEAASSLAADGVSIARVGEVPGAFEICGGSFWTSTLHGDRRAIAQDGASAAIVEWLGARPGQRVLDLCAGRGAKSLFLAASGAEVDLVDIESDKLADAVALADQAGLRLGKTLVGDAGQALPLDHGGYDAVLVDAPCSGLGTLRRRPEIATRRSMADVIRLAGVQRAILRRAADAVRPGGLLLFAVCTISAEESVDAVEDFLAARDDFARDPAGPASQPAWLRGWLDARGDLRSHPGLHGVDCFYAARLRRAAVT